MRQSFIRYLERSPASVLCIMTLSFLAFGYFSINLFLTFRANLELINQFGWIALQEGAAIQLAEVLSSAFASVIFYTIWKVCERLLVDWAILPRR